jgi:hypothetical protein
LSGRIPIDRPSFFFSLLCTLVNKGPLRKETTTGPAFLKSHQRNSFFVPKHSSTLLLDKFFRFLILIIFFQRVCVCVLSARVHSRVASGYFCRFFWNQVDGQNQ